MNKVISNVNVQGLIDASTEPIVFFNFEHNFWFFICTYCVGVTFFSFTDNFFYLELSFFFQFVLIGHCPQQLKNVLFLISAFNDSIQSLNWYGKYFEFLFANKSYLFLSFSKNSSKNCFIYLSKLWWYETGFGINCLVSSCRASKKLKNISLVLKLS